MIVVLGAFGKTGRAVATLVRTQGGRAVRLITRDPTRTLSLPGAELAVASLSDAAALERAFHGGHALYAILPDELRATHFHAERRAMAEAIATAVRHTAIARVVLLSSLAAAHGEHDGNNGLGADLAYFERLILETHAQVTILRASYFQDNVSEALPIATRDGVYPNFLPRTGAIATIAARDVGTIAARALLEPPRSQREIVDLIGPAYTPIEIAETLGDVLGRRLSIIDVPPSDQETTFRQWMSPEAARAMVETLGCLAAGRLRARDDRVEQGETSLADVLRTALARTPLATPASSEMRL